VVCDARQTGGMLAIKEVVPPQVEIQIGMAEVEAT